MTNQDLEDYANDLVRDHDLTARYHFVSTDSYGLRHQLCFYGERGGILWEYCDVLDWRHPPKEVAGKLPTIAKAAVSAFMGWMEEDPEEEEKRPATQPECDCGAEKADGIHARWCSKKQWLDEMED